MALDNLISIEFSAEDLQKIDDSLTTIETVIAGKVIALQNEERSRYGRVGENTQNWISKVQGHMDSKPNLIPPFIDTTEFGNDLAARMSIMPRLARLNAVATGLEDTAILLGNDLYNAALAYYGNIKMMTKQNVPGAKPIYEDLNQQFPGRPKSVKAKTDTETK